MTLPTSAKATDLLPALPITHVPTWAGAVWIGTIDIASTDRPAVYRLRDSAGYTRARLMVRRGRQVIGFVDVAVRAGAVDSVELLEAVSRLHHGPGSTVSESAAPEPITVVVCTRDRVEMLKDALASILELDYPELSVIVVDNASALRKPATTSPLSVTRGCGWSSNRYPVCRGPAMRVCQPPPRTSSRSPTTTSWSTSTGCKAWLTDSIGGGQSGCVCGIVPSGEIRTPAQAYFDQRVGWARSCKSALFELDSPPADVPLFPFQVGIYGTGANFAIRRSVVFYLGGFDEALGVGAPTAGGEDLDMFFRVLLAGWQLAYEPSAVVWHRHRADNDALAVQARGYGLGLGAWLTKIALNPRTAWLALRTVATQARTAGRLGYQMSKAASPPDSLAPLVPIGVGKLELTSIFRGPFAYRAARREGRRAAPLTGVRNAAVAVDR